LLIQGVKDFDSIKKPNTELAASSSSSRRVSRDLFKPSAIHIIVFAHRLESSSVRPPQDEGCGERKSKQN